MRFQKQESTGGPPPESALNEDNSDFFTKLFTSISSTLPFGQPIAFSSINGPTYLTAQTLVQQVAYFLSDKIYSYSPETFDLDLSAKGWSASKTANVNGYVTSVLPMQTRSGAGSIALGYMFSKDFDSAKRHIPQSLLASSSSLDNLQEALNLLSHLRGYTNPLVAHIAAVNYCPSASKDGNHLVTDYISAITAAELGLGLVSSTSPYEVQHMSLFATLLATVLPTIHIYDGINLGRETVRVIDVLNQAGLRDVYKNVSKALSETAGKPVEYRTGHLLQAFNNELGTTYELFEYNGHSSPQTVMVVFGSAEASLGSQVAIKFANTGARIGVVNVRVYQPFVEEAFLATLPSSTRTITVLGQVENEAAVGDKAVRSSLYMDVLAALAFSDKWASTPAVVDVKYSKAKTITPTFIATKLNQATDEPTDSEDQFQLLSYNEAEQFVFYDLDDAATTSAPVAIGKHMSGDSAINISLKQTYDNLVQGGAVRTDIRSSKRSIEASYSVEEADIVVVGDEKLLKDIDILTSVKAGGQLVLKLPGVKDDELEKKLPNAVRKAIQGSKIQLFILDPNLSSAVKDDALTEALLLEQAFLKVARPQHLDGSIGEQAPNNQSTTLLEKILTDLEKALRRVDVPASWANIEPETQVLPPSISTNSFAKFDKEDVEPLALLKDWQSVAKGLLFKEAYGTESSLRPDLSVKTFSIKVKENRRLTPLTYNRNIFHIEFDIGNSGLKYDIGEALGIHAENNEAEVHEFVKFYGLDPEDVVEVPSREDPEVLETRTVYQSLMQNIDIFGKPPKRFYEALAEFATDEDEKKKLITLGGPEGATEFKRRAEVDTVTYADILLEFRSAHPSFHDIARIVSPMKRREYSIASSQRVNPDSIALMIVVVDWVDPKGRVRLGQATRYLSQLSIGTPVTVSVKPSVMKLPSKDTSPLIMAGLGTGLAPFRAFVQYRAMQKSQGKEIGPILLYMGSRHQREEYLYGEEWEAYQDAGVITLLGRAFSRDQPQKIYIQDRMRETMAHIIDAYIRKEGAFYLCGPTWPVPDVTEVLQEAITRDAKAHGKKVDPKKEIERLKDDMRYVLEVY
jgi:sulfite reductase (NADPH) flavoprotein alpha-component